MSGREFRADYSVFAPENSTTLPHFSVSSAMSFPKSAPSATSKRWEGRQAGIFLPQIREISGLTQGRPPIWAIH
jgi:hypothetical protein